MNIKQLTIAVQLFASQILDLKNVLDNDMFNHVSLVANRCLLELKNNGASRETLIICGKYLLRLLNVIDAYNSKKRDVSIAELLNIVSDFKAVFVGS